MAAAWGPTRGMNLWPRSTKKSRLTAKGRASAAGQPMDVADLGVVHDDEWLAADATRGRNGYGFDRGDGYGSVEGVAAVGEDARACGCGEWRDGDDYAAVGIDCASARFDVWSGWHRNASKYRLGAIVS